MPIPRPHFFVRRTLGLALALGLGLTAFMRPAAATVPVSLAEMPALWLSAVRALPLLLDALSPGPCLAIGYPAFGWLENAVKPESGTGLWVRSRDSWATPETANGLRRAALEVATLYPGKDDLVVTDISRRHGGHFRPHRTHQTGRDVDVLLYKAVPSQGRPGARSPGEADLERTFALIMALRKAETTDLVLVDRALQVRLHEYARVAVGLPEAELAELFQYPKPKTGPLRRDTFLRHAAGHRTHLHIRFRAPESEAAAARADARIGVSRQVHTVERGETLTALAAQYQTTPLSIVTENRLGPRTKLHRGQRLFVLRPVPEAQVIFGRPRPWPESTKGG